MGSARVRFFAALGLFIAWVIGLGIMAYTSSEKPRATERAASTRRPG